MIEKWIQPQHLKSDSIEMFREMFETETTAAMRIPNFLNEDVAQGLFDFCKNDANWVKSLSLRKQAKVSEEAWNNAPEKDRFFSMWNLNPDDIAKRGDGLKLFSGLMSDLRNDQSMAAWFASITGLPIKKGASVSAKAYGAHDFLGPHNDRTSDRRLAFIMYLSQDWQSTYGGGLYMRMDGQPESFLEYEFNSLILFDVNKKQKHWIDPIRSECGDRMRYSIGGWFNENKNQDGQDE